MLLNLVTGFINPCTNIQGQPPLVIAPNTKNVTRYDLVVGYAMTNSDGTPGATFQLEGGTNGSS